MKNDLEARRRVARKAELYNIKKNNRKMLLLSITSVSTFLILWQMVVIYNIVDTRFLASPIDVIKAIILKMTSKTMDGGLLYQHIIESAKVVWLGFFTGALIGVPLGLFMGWYKSFNRLVRPLFEVVRPIPALAWIPIVLLFLGIGTEARVAIIFFGSFVAIVLNTYTGIQLTNPSLINVAKTCGATNVEIFWRIGIPSAMPLIFAGFKISMGASWATVVAAEMLAASKGLGYMIQIGRMFAEVDIIIAGIVVIGMMGLISSWLVGLVESVVLKWRPKINEK